MKNTKEDKRTIKLTKQFSPDKDDSSSSFSGLDINTYYLVRLGELTLYGSYFEDKAKERFDHIVKIGLKAYLEEIRITSTLIEEQEIGE